MIYKTENGYVISSGHVWIPGAYDSERAAKYAFRFPDKELQELQNKKNPTLITFKDLQELRKTLSNQQTRL